MERGTRLAISMHDGPAHPWRIVDPTDGSVVATAADRSLAMVRTHHLLAPDGPYPRLSLECDAFSPRHYLTGDIGDHAKEEYTVDCQQYVLRAMGERLARIADEAAQLAAELDRARDSLRALSDDMIDDPDDLAALNHVGSRIVDRYGKHPLLAAWYASLDLVRDAVATDAR